VGVVLIAGAVAAVLARGAGNYGSNSAAVTSQAPRVGWDLHALIVLEDRVFVSGHDSSPWA